MRKLELANYTVKMKAPDRLNPGKQIEIEGPYYVKDSILNLMFCRELGLAGAELVKQSILAEKIENCKEDFILLEEEEWQRIKRATEVFRGFTRPDVVLVKRITEAEKVDVKPA